MSKARAIAWNGKSRGGGVGHFFFVWTLRYLGVRAAYALLAFVAIYFVPFAPRSTKALWGYYRRRWGMGRLATCWRIYVHYYRFGQTIIDKIAVRLGYEGRYSFTFDGLERMLELLNGGSGAIILGAHVGCWEIGSGFFGEYGKRMNVVMLDAESRQIKEVLEQEGNANYKVLPIGEDNLETVIRIRTALQEGEYVCFQGDRYLHEEDTLRVGLLGKEARLPLGPFLLSAKMRVPVILYFALREKGRCYRFIFREIPPQQCATPQQVAECYAGVLSDTLRSYKSQWFNLYNYWQE